jgi:hypothetical protein
MAPIIAIHKIHVRGGTRNSPLFFSLLSSAMMLKKCAGNYHPRIPTATAFTGESFAQSNVASYGQK